MADTEPTLTAAELYEIVERVAGCEELNVKKFQAEIDRARLNAALMAVIGVAIMKSGNRYCIPGMPGDLIWFDTKDAAIDALLGGGK